MLKSGVRTLAGIVVLLPAVLLLSSCAKPEVRKMGGPCSYEEFAGSARFVELKPLQAGVEAFFVFTPADAKVTEKYRFDRNQKGPASMGIHSAEWFAAKGVAVGRELPAVYKELRTGTCSPTFFSFPTISDAHGE